MGRKQGKASDHEASVMLVNERREEGEWEGGKP